MESVGVAWFIFSCLVESGPVLSIPESFVTFMRRSRRTPPIMSMALLEGHFSISLIEYTTFKVKPKPLQEEHKSSHEDLLAAESDPSPSTPSDSAIEPSPEPGTSKGEEILSPKSPSQFEDDPYRTIETPRISFMPN
jgi:hypothetical protein